MKLLCVCATFLLLPAVMRAQDPKPAQPDFNAEYEKLAADHEAAEQSFIAEMRKKYEEQAKKAEQEAKEAESKPADGQKTTTAAVPTIGAGMGNGPTSAFVPKFEDLAQRAKGTDAAVKALTWLLLNGRGPTGGLTVVLAGKVPPKDTAESAQDRAQKLLLADYMDSPALEEACLAFRHVGFGDRVKSAEEALRKILAQSPHKNIKAASTAALAMLLCEDDGISYRPDASGEWKPVQRYADGVVEKRKAEAKDLMLAMRKNYADAPAFVPVEAYLFEMEHMQIGMPVPDFTATDVDGNEFKLSDYRGKVVMLDFWGYW